MSPVIPRDGVIFLGLARDAAGGDPGALLRHDQHPLYPALVALARPLAGGWEAAGLAVSIIAGTLTVVPAVLIGRRVAGAGPALLGGWVLAFSRYQVQVDAQAISDALHAFLFAAAVLAGAAALRLGEETRAAGGGAGEEAAPRFGRGRWFLAAGLLSGLAFLARPEGLLAAAALLAAGAAKLLARPRLRDAAALARGGGLTALALAITAGPYVAAISAAEGRLTLTRKKPLLATLSAGSRDDTRPSSPPGAPGGGAPPATAPAPAPLEPPPLADADATRAPPGPRSRLGGAVTCLRRFLEGFGWIPSGLLVLGLVLRRSRRAGILGEIYLLAPLVLLGVLLSGVYVTSGYIGRRHLYAAGPLLEGWVGLGFVAVAGALGRFWPRAAGPRAPAVLAALAVLAMAPKAMDILPEPGGDAAALRQREIGRSLRGLVPEEDRVLLVGDISRVSFYAGWRMSGATFDPGPAGLSAACAEAEVRGSRWVAEEVDPSATGGVPPGYVLRARAPHGAREVRLYGPSR